MRAWAAGNLLGVAELAYVRAQMALWRFDYAEASRWLNRAAIAYALAAALAPRGVR